MRSRPWILALALIVTFLALIMYHGWTLFKANERIKNYLLSQLRPALGEQCDIESLDVALGAVHLKGVNIIFENSYYALWIEDLRIGYNLASLIKSGFKPEKSPQDILFVNPQLTITQLPEEKNADSSLPYQNYWDKVRDFDFLKRITVSKGSIIYVDSLSHKTTLANDISGWISIRDVRSAKARLVGKLFQSKQLNLRLNGEIDLIKAKLDFLRVNLINFQWTESNPFFISQYFDIQQGKVNGDIIISEKSDQGFDIAGNLSIADGAIKFQKESLNLTNINLNADIRDWNLIINKSHQLFNDSPVSIEGRIKNILDPQIDLKIYSQSFDIEQFQKYLRPDTKLKLAGKSSLSLSVFESYRNPLIKGSIDCPRLLIGNDKIDDVKIKLFFQDSVLTINSFSAKHKSLKLFGNGNIDFTRSDNMINMQFVSRGEIPSDFKIAHITSLANSHCQLSLNVKGNFHQIKGQATLAIKPQFNDSLILNYKNSFVFANNILTFSTSSLQNKASIDGSLVFKKRGIRCLLNLINIHETIYQLPEFKAWQKGFDFANTQFEIKSQPKKLEISGNYAWKNGKEAAGNLTIKIKDDYRKKKIQGNLFAKFGDQFYKGEINIIKKPHVIELKKIAIDDIFLSDGTIDLVNGNEIKGKILVSNSDLNHIINLFTLNSSLINKGKVFGTINLGGTISQPNANGQLKLKNGYFNEIGNYDGLLSFSLMNDILSINQFQLTRNDETIFEIDGNYLLDSDQADFKLSSNGIDLNNLFRTLFKSSDLIVGQATADLRLTGSITNPLIIGNVRVGNGKFDRFKFDSLYLDLGGPQKLAQSELEGIIIDKFQLTRSNEFQIEAQGVIPFTSEKNMHIDFEGQGNLLSILPEITPFFKETASNGKWQVHFTGSPDNLIIESGQIQIEDGYLKLDAVAPKIDNIYANITIKNDGFVHVKEISGTIKGKPFAFSNNKAATICCAKKLVPFSVPDFGLDFGVFCLTTFPKGVPLHIPNLMPKKETGYFEFIGRDSCEKFYFAGPVANPVVRGNVRLRNVTIMYPFDETSTTDSSIIAILLRKIDWNVKAIPVKDIRYEKEIPSGIDNVYVNLLIDSGVGGLDFSGIIENNTFNIAGPLESTEGTVDYLDFNFHIEKAGVEFDRTALYPMAYGRAKTTIVDSLGIPINIYLTLLLEDETGGYSQTRGRWDNIRFQLSSDSPNLGNTEGEILASLGYSAENIKEKATDIIGISTDNLIFRPLFRPFERQLERTFNLDMVRFSSRFTRNLIEMNLWGEELVQPNSKLYLFRSTKLTVGKYLADKLFLLYTGQLESAMNYRYHGEGLGLKYRLGLEYRINSDLQLEMEYNYNSFLLERKDIRVFLRHSFSIQ